MSAIVLSVEYQVGNGSPEPTLTRLTTALERAGAEVANVGKHILPRLIPLFEGEVSKQFEGRGVGPQSGSWAALSSKYAAWKERVTPGRPLLVLSGALGAALTESADTNAERTINGDSLTYGTKGVPYATFHQTGTGKMPARPVFDFSADFEEGMQAAAMAGVREAVREASDGLLDFEGDTFEGQQVQTGKSGGRYIQTDGGGRTYLKRNAAGDVVKRGFGGRR